jgi:hypothetical protein
MAYKEYKYDPYVRAWNRIADRGEVCSGNFDPRNNPDDRRRLIAGIVLVVAFILLFVLFSGCTRRVYVPVERTTTVTEIVKDTVVEVILEVRKDTVNVEAAGRDTTSYLENGTHFSRATWKDGKLGHSLGTLPGASVKDTVPVKMVIIRDSIPYPVEVEVEKKLSWWQRQKMEYGGIAIGAAAFFAFVTGMLLKGARKRD